MRTLGGGGSSCWEYGDYNIYGIAMNIYGYQSIYFGVHMDTFGFMQFKHNQSFGGKHDFSGDAAARGNIPI